MVSGGDYLKPCHGGALHTYLIRAKAWLFMGVKHCRPISPVLLIKPSGIEYPERATVPPERTQPLP